MTKKTIAGIAAALALACLAACAIPQPGMYGGLGRKITASPAPVVQQQYVDEAIEITSEPPGARIHVNDSFAGHAPLGYTVRRLWRGEPGRMVLDAVKVEALPVAGGQCVQSGVYGQNNARVPTPVRFVMTSCSAAK